MKKIVLAALIGATILTPAAAIAQDRGGRENRGGEAREQRQQQRQEFRAQRQEQRQERPQFQRPDRPERPQVQPRPAPAPATAPAPQVREQRRDFREERRDDRRDFRGERREDRRDLRGAIMGSPQTRDERRDDRRDYRDDRRDDRRDYRDDRRDDRRDYRGDRRDDRRDYRQDRRYGDWRDTRTDRRSWDDNRNWNRSWRGDRRYNWSGYRASNRHVYRLPRYYAPRGYHYGYRRFSIGITIGSMLFAPDYWINDPFYYRLPPAYGPYRWVRYYNDALLVDVRSGYVVDVIHDIFW